MAKTIGIIAVKGGVGKTTVSASLAAELANRYDKKVLLVDANYSAPNLGLHMDIIQPEKTIHDVLAGRSKLASAIHQRYGVDVIPGSYFFMKPVNSLKLKDKLKALKSSYDYIVLDSSPTLNDEILSTILASDHLFIVSTPDYPTLSCTFRAVKLAKQRDKKVSGIILNKISNPKYEVGVKDIEDILSLPVVASIPHDESNVKALFNRIPVTLYNRRAKFSKEINELCAALTNHKEKRSVFEHLLPLDVRKEQVNRQLLKQNLFGNRTI